MARTAFAEKIKKVREDAQAPYKTQIALFQMGKILTEPIKPAKEKTAEEVKKEKEESKILSEGLEAVASLGEISYAVSTPKRFSEWAEHNKLHHEEWDMIDRKDWNKNSPIKVGDEYFIPVEEFSQHGYGAWHIGDRINGLQKEGREVLIVDTRRNRRFLFKKAKKEELERKL